MNIMNLRKAQKKKDHPNFGSVLGQTSLLTRAPAWAN
jgi:hypothetical protein